MDVVAAGLRSAIEATPLEQDAEDESKRRWPSDGSARFRSPAKQYGALSNFARAYPLRIDGIVAPTAEHLYQALRFPGSTSEQIDVLAAADPRTAKQLAHERFDAAAAAWWATARVDAMRWVLHVKTVQHLESIRQVLLATVGLPIVEESRHDRFWGAEVVGPALIGANMLGRLWMAIRDELAVRKIENAIPRVRSDLRLFDRPLSEVDAASADSG